METSEALKSYVGEKLERIQKYIDEPVVAQVFLTVEKIRHIAEMTITAKGITIKASEETNDMYAAVDAVLDKIERQLRRYKEKIKEHKPSTEAEERKVTKSIVEAESLGQKNGAGHYKIQDLFHQTDVGGRSSDADGPVA
jgi:putative sigma-54 modulation protein